MDSTSANTGPARRKHIDWATRTVRLELFILLVGCALLLAAMSLYLGFSGSSNSEFDRVSKNKFQAVFLNGGGVTKGSAPYSTYVGQISKMTDKYLVLQNVYYLTAGQTAQNAQSNPQVTKLGCQQYSPYDEMVINRNQVAFWENLKSDGKVVQAIVQYVTQNPNGPSC